MSRSRFFPLALAVLALTSCGTGDDSTETADEDITEEQTEGPAPDDTDTEAADQSQPDGSEDAADTPNPEETDSVTEAEAEESAVEASVEYVATAEGPGQVAAGFGDHDFEDFTDSWTESEEVDSRFLSMSVEADEGIATCEILVDGEPVVEEQDENGSVYCPGVIE